MLFPARAHSFISVIVRRRIRGSIPLNGSSFQDVNYDTTQTPVPLSGVRCTIRVWDFPTRFARQLSLMQDL